MTRLLPLVLLGLLVLLAGCSPGPKNPPGPKNLILGKWDPQDGFLKGKGVVAEITASEITMRGPGGGVVSPYRFVSDDTIEAETTWFETTCKNRYTLVFDGDKMTWIDQWRGMNLHFRRIK